MKHPSPLILFIGVIIFFSSCAGKLLKQDAERILRKSYSAGYDPDEAGGSHTIISSLQVDSIRQSGDTALVFYRLSGSVENGSKYPVSLDEREQEARFKKGVFEWKEK